MQGWFSWKLIEWHFNQNKRIMPWKGEKDPYKIWISEIILQQTRVLQGLSYYEKFIEKYPTLKSLADAPDEAVFKLWEGLGYYTRCRNILFTAREVLKKMNGIFPSDYDSLLKLKGIGPYTAAAISSFAYGLPHAVLDGNVFRVLSRFFGEDTPIDSPAGKKHFSTLATKLLFKKDSAAYNQAIMDFGATICKPQIPLCQHCILQNKCIAYKMGLVNKLPIKEKRLIKKKRWFTYFIFRVKDEILVNQRAEKDIWQNLFEFYLFETEKAREWQPGEIEKWLYEQLGIGKADLLNISPEYTQQLTHQKLYVTFIAIGLTEVPGALSHYRCVKENNLNALSFPKVINEYLQHSVEGPTKY